MSSSRHPRVASLRTPERLRAHLEGLGAALPCDDAIEPAPASPLAAPLDLGHGLTAPNRFVIHPMEGWDATEDGRPSELTRRRWRRFGASGAGWVWGGEAVAVRDDGRANPNQLLMTDANAPALAALREELQAEARAAGHPEPVVGLQLTHSGRWSVPRKAQRRPRTAHRHPILDARVGIDSDAALLDDAEVDVLVADFARAARLARDCGFAFVDVKHCHGYLLHEFLCARARSGRFGGASIAARSALALTMVDAVAEAAPDLPVGVRLSVFDALPHHRSEPGGEGVPESHPLPYPLGFGIDPATPTEIDLAEPIALVRALADRGVRWINATAASPYYAPHVQRPALFPPSDGYPPPEDPLCGVTRLLRAARDLKAAVPDVRVVASGLSYLQDFAVHVSQACVREGWFDAVGLGRMALSYPHLPADALGRGALERRLICRTFSDCTTAPRNGLVSGCFPLDPLYREMPERETLEAIKAQAEASGADR